MTLEALKEKYSSIETKIPSVWENYNDVALSLAQDLLYHWNIKDSELIRVISLVSLNSKTTLTRHIDHNFAFSGLYPQIIQPLNIYPK